MNIKDNPRHRLEAKSVTEQAAEWMIVLEDKGEEANPAFADWLRESPTHVQAYLRAATLDTMMKRIDPQHSLEIEKPEPGSVEPDIAPALDDQQPRRTVHWRLAAGIAAVGVLAAVWATFELSGGLWKTYRTEVGEQRTVALEDGSMLMLNTDSRVQVRFNESERQLRILSGEAMFRAQRDPSRPFEVHSNGAVVRAIGTEFNVYRKIDQTIVSVLDGRVAVGDTFLNAGEGVRIDAGGKTMAKTQVDIAKVAAWRQRRLVFIDEPLSTISHEFNRYNRAPKIRVEGAAARDRRYAVILDADEPESLLAVLAGDPRVAVERSAGEILIRDNGGQP